MAVLSSLVQRVITFLRFICKPFDVPWLAAEAQKSSQPRCLKQKYNSAPKKPFRETYFYQNRINSERPTSNKVLEKCEIKKYTTKITR